MWHMTSEKDGYSVNRAVTTEGVQEEYKHKYKYVMSVSQTTCCDGYSWNIDARHTALLGGEMRRICTSFYGSWGEEPASRLDR